MIGFKRSRNASGLVSCAPVKDATLRTKVNNVAEKFFFYRVDAFETQHLSNTR
jgi:hypothetical protein